MIATDALQQSAGRENHKEILELIEDYAEARHICGWHAYNAKTAEARAKVIARLAASAGSEAVAPDGWLHERGLLYRLTDERHPCNRDEINVTMADGSRSIEARSRRALELLDRIRATHHSPPEGMAGGWISVDERLPDLMVNVLAGYWHQDTWLNGKPEVFSYGVCRMYEAPDDPCFPQGKRWQTHGCAHSAITHWMPLPPPPTTPAGSGRGE